MNVERAQRVIKTETETGALTPMQGIGTMRITVDTHIADSMQGEKRLTPIDLAYSQLSMLPDNKCSFILSNAYFRTERGFDEVELSFLRPTEAEIEIELPANPNDLYLLKYLRSLWDKRILVPLGAFNPDQLLIEGLQEDGSFTQVWPPQPSPQT